MVSRSVVCIYLDYVSIWITAFRSYLLTTQLLKTIFNRKDLFEIDSDKLMKIEQELRSTCIFTVDYRKCLKHGEPDALSRNPVNDRRRTATLLWILENT